MRASLFHEHGGPEVLEFTDFPTPEPTPDQILVEVKGVALNHLDLFVRGGIPGINLEMPHILGSDISGVVKEKGDAVTNSVEVGEKVIIDPGLSCGNCEFCRMGGGRCSFFPVKFSLSGSIGNKLPGRGFLRGLYTGSMPPAGSG
jgi:NADPH2:quinone reductase